MRVSGFWTIFTRDNCSTGVSYILLTCQSGCRHQSQWMFQSLLVLSSWHLMSCCKASALQTVPIHQSLSLLRGTQSMV